MLCHLNASISHNSCGKMVRSVEINSLATSLVETLLSRYFCQKSENNVHSVEKEEILSHQQNIS